MPRKGRINSKGQILCSMCGRFKDKNEFLSNNLKKYRYACQTCLIKYRKDLKPRINRIIDNIYTHQKHSRYKVPVLYTWEELSEWVMNNKKFMKLYQEWLAFNMCKSFMPSIIRIDSKKPYSLNNLKVLTARKALLLNTQKRQRPVVQITKEGVELARYPNAKVAAEIIGIKNFSNIHMVCKGVRKTAKGYIWKYV